MKTNDLRKTKAITLIALIVSIIVLLILARSQHSCANWGKPELLTEQQRQKRLMKKRR